MGKGVNFAIVGVDTDAAKLFIEQLALCDDIELGTLYPLEKFPEDYDAIRFKEKNYLIEKLDDFDFSQVKIAIFFGSPKNVEAAIIEAHEQGCYVIDGTGSFSKKADTLLAIPDINSDDIISLADRILVSPNPNTIAIAIAMHKIAADFSLDSLNISALESVSGKGKAGTSELVGQAVALLSGKPIVDKIYPAQVAFNVIPTDLKQDENSEVSYEQSIVNEIHEFISEPSVTGSVSYTSVTVPVFYGHSYLVNFETSIEITSQDLENIWNGCDNIDYLPNEVVTPVTHGVNRDKVCICKLQKGVRQNEFKFYMVMDNTLKGNALNCIGILRLLIDNLL